MSQEHLRMSDKTNASTLLDAIEVSLSELENETYPENEVNTLNIRYSPVKNSPVEKLKQSKKQVYFFFISFSNTHALFSTALIYFPHSFLSFFLIENLSTHS